MLPQCNTSGSPIYSLQTMLRAISFQYPCIPRLIPDGIFGERTLEAVMLFQREFFPPVTGQVDNATWDAIVNLYQQSCRSLAPPRPCSGYPSRDYTICPGERCVHLCLIQSMFIGLARILEGLEAEGVSGTLDDVTANNIRWIQRQNQAEETGIIDQFVWDTLTRLYMIFVTYAQTPGISRPELFHP